MHATSIVKMDPYSEGVINSLKLPFYYVTFTYMPPLCKAEKGFQAFSVLSALSLLVFHKAPVQKSFQRWLTDQLSGNTNRKEFVLFMTAVISFKLVPRSRTDCPWAVAILR